ncbi:transposase [Streptomyces sp. NPDC020298]|uniref:transposase n=1 Tax=unclassified Streptomyces TaxID=2593676 RepID=UPI0033D6ABA3
MGDPSGAPTPRACAGWLSELEGVGGTHARLTAVLGGAAPDLRGLSSSERRCLIESVRVRVDIVDPVFRQWEGKNCLTIHWHERTSTLIPPDPTDSQWARIEGLLRSRYSAHHFRSPLDLRSALMGMLHRLRSGVCWSDLPERSGEPTKVKVRQRTWLVHGVWADIVKRRWGALLSADAGPGMMLNQEACSLLAPPCPVHRHRTPLGGPQGRRARPFTSVP